MLILIVLAFRGCLEARKERGLRNYTSDVSTIMGESEQRGKDFFELLESPGNTTAIEYRDQVNSLRGASESLLNRAENLDPPGEMQEGNDAVLLTLKLRRDALGTIGDNVSAALGTSERAEPIARITDQMKALYASDILYSQVAVPDIDGVIESEGVTNAQKLPPGNFMPEGTAQDWLDQNKVIEALGGVSATSAVSGSHGIGLLSVSIGGTALTPDVPANVASNANEIDVQVQNQGDTDENDVEVVVTIGGEEFTQTIPSIAPGGTESAKIGLPTLPQPGTETTVDVSVTPVSGEQVTDNNSASYTVTFGSG